MQYMYSFCLAFLSLSLHVTTHSHHVCTVHPAHCDRSSFRCFDFNCVNYVTRCDGHSNCSDGSDEVACLCESHFMCILATPWCLTTNSKYIDKKDITVVCMLRFFLMYEHYWEQSLYPDTSCQSYQFQCGNGICVAASERCNHYADCTDGSDEQECGKTW